MSRPLLAVALALLALAGGACATAEAAGPRRVEIRIHHSRFLPSSFTVPAGVPVTVVLRNDDPIDHEWLIGDAAFHARHRAGGEPAHADRPDEVSLPAFATRTTTLILQPGTHVFICHFPGHERYGMAGTITAR